MENHFQLRSRFRGAFLGCLLGDALGRLFEMMSGNDSRLAPALDARLAGKGPWFYSDDTQMMMSVAESIVRTGRVSAMDILATLAANYEPTRGYGSGMRRALEAFRSGRGVGFSSWAEGSKGNGAAVRGVPIACAYHDDMESLAAFAEEAAGITHAHPLGRGGAVAMAIALGAVLAREPVSSLLARVTQARAVAGTILATKIENAWQLAREQADGRTAASALGNGIVAEDSVPLAFFCFLRWAPHFDDVVKNAILAGGDTDTIAAMAGALCGAQVGEEGLPATWLGRVERGPKGIEAVKELADGVFALWEKRALAR
ncbi:ADP-ribosylglycohydrolase family protein [Pendulispora brunnea]|uniref:ADP-ribosylglycohydrolase family protein n=1 Tax=Pendulispora brunnea TaxID=2905690 RepID=A0ABZ2K2L5_9BACT